MAETTRDDDTDKNSSYSETLASWKRIQTNTFVRWVNEHLKSVGGEPVVDLETDFSDGVRLITLVEALTGKKFPRRYNRNPTLRNQKLENVTLALEFLEREEKIRLVNIDSSNIVDHNDKLLLGLLWSLIIHYSISTPTWEGEADSTRETKPDLTPKQRLLAWIQNKIPEQHVTNFTSDWRDGRNIGALVESIAPGICPDWHLWQPEDALENAKKAMALAEEWLNVPQLISPDELTDPKADELSAMTYLAQFPNAKLKSPIRVHRTETYEWQFCIKSALPKWSPTFASISGVRKTITAPLDHPGACAEGPGVVGVPLEFTVDSLDGEMVSANVKVFDPDGVEKQVDQVRAGNSKSLLFSFRSEMEGQHKISVTAENREDLPEHILMVDVRGSVSASGPGLRPRGVIPLWKTSFDIHSENMVVESVDVSIVQPETANGAILDSDVNHVKSTGLWRVEYIPLVEGPHTINVTANGFVIPGSPFHVLVSAEGAERVSVRGRGVQASGVRVGEDAVVILEVQDSSQEPNCEVDMFSSETDQRSSVDVSKLDVSVTDPDGSDVQTDFKYHDQQVQYNYKPEKVGKFNVKATYGGQNIRGSPFLVNVSPAIERKTRAFGPGLRGGIAGFPACFTVDRHEDETFNGVSVDGPLPVETEIKENEDGSKDVVYFPTVAGEHAVHVFCNDEDIPGSPFMADIRQATDGFNPTKVVAYGSGLKETGVVVDEWAEFVVDTTLAGKEDDIQIEAFDDEYDVVDVELEQSDAAGVVECRYKPKKPVQHRIFISYAGVNIIGGPFRVQVQDNPATYPVVELPVEVSLVGQENSQAEDSDNDASLELQASQVKAYGDGLHIGYAGHLSSFVVVMSEFSVECLGVAVDGPCKVEMDCLETKEGYKFTYVPRTAGDFVVSINYAGKFPIPGSPFHVIIKEVTNLYSIRVYTGNKLFAGTDANVFITLFGEIGDTGTIQLKYSRTHLNKFERNQMDEFFVEVFNIGDLKKIKIAHDNKGKIGAAWFLDRVEIESTLLGKQWVFPFRRWLSKGDLAVEMVATEDTERRIVEGDSPVMYSDDQEMSVEEVTKSAGSTVSCENAVETEPCAGSDTPGAYYIYVYTGNKLFGGTDANVCLQLFGEHDDSGVLELKSSKTNRNKFERNQKDEFVFDIPDVGNLEKIRIGHDNSGLFGSSWFLDRVEVESTLLSKKWLFPFNQWLSKEKKGCSLEAEIHAQGVIQEGQNELSGDQDLDSIDLTDANVKATGPGLEKQLNVNVPTSFSVDVSEAEPGNLLLLSVQGPSEPCGVNMTYEGEGIYGVSFHPRETGVHVITIKWGKRYISGSPFIVTVV